MSKSSYASVPSGAPGRPEPFTLHVPEPELDDFRQLLRLSKIAPETWENSERHGDANLGLTREWLVQARDAWLDDFDWRAHEAYINSFPNFRIRVPDHAAPAGQQQQQEEEEEGHLDLHFAALFSTRPDAIPVVFMHGWPGSFLEFLPMLDLLRVKYAADQLPFHAVVPSLPGYTLSGGPPRTRDFTLSDAARAMHQLMVELGFGGGYVAQGGDVGYFLARIMSATYDGCKALHVNFLFPAPNEMPQGVEGLTESEKEHLERTQKWRSTGMAYAMEHATRPATIGLVLSSSPLALLAWIGEKLVQWVDKQLPLPTILRMVSLYWFTSTFPRCIYPYRTIMGNAGRPFPVAKDKPLGYSRFPKEMGLVPQAWSYLFPNMKFYAAHTEGGHFAALEQPEAFLADVEKFVIEVVKHV